MDGIINIHKEKGFTSHDVVAKMRGILRTRKIGHTGTLDPDATGVLPVCVGMGTRLCSVMEDHDKTYRAVLLLGLETDTQDISGKVLCEKPVTCTEDQVHAVLDHFRGPIMQIPPMYSALKVNGKKLYEYAREGITIERKPRPITIDELVVEAMELPRITLRVSCSKGTYIRTLCNDIGAELGCGGCMESLVRTRVGQFHLEDAITLGQLEALRDEQKLDTVLLSVEEAFADLPVAKIKPEFEKMIRNGNRVKGKMFRLEGSYEAGSMVRMYDQKEQFVGVYEPDPERKDWKPFKMFI